MSDHQAQPLAPKQHKTKDDPEPQEEGEKWFEKENIQTADTDKKAAADTKAPCAEPVKVTAPAGGTKPSSTAAPIEDSPVMEEDEPRVIMPEQHDHIYDNFPKGKLCKDNCPEKKPESVAAPDPYASQLTEGTSS